MYAARVEGEIDKHPELYRRNPEAQQFYLKGVKDLLNSLAIVEHEHADPAVLAVVLEAFHEEVSALPPTGLSQ